MWKAIFKHRILLFHQAELFLPFSKRCYHAFQILGSKMEQKPNKLSRCFSEQSFLLCLHSALTVNQNHSPLGTILIELVMLEHDHKYSHVNFICIPNTGKSLLLERKVPSISCPHTILLCLCLAAYSGCSFSCPKNPSMQNSSTEYSSSPGHFKSHWQILAQIKAFGIQK